MSWTRTMRLTAACGFALVAAACDSGPPQPEELEAQAAERVEALFQAGGEGDCATLQALVGTVTSPALCERFVHKWTEHEMRLVEIAEARVDGRNPRAVIVKTVAMKQGRQTTMLIHAQWDEKAGWTLEL